MSSDAMPTLSVMFGNLSPKHLLSHRFEVNYEIHIRGFDQGRPLTSMTETADSVPLDRL